jgi:glycerol-3-phosphate dehydrogenase
LVVGGGIHGVIAAWDAALRGLSVALIERGDFGCETSQNSLKVIHGGLRYLQDGNIFRIRKMARERTTWMKIAPHLVHPLTCLMPTQNKLSRSRFVLAGALLTNDLISFDRNQLEDGEKHLPNGKIISKQELADIIPGYDLSASTGAASWYDAQVYNTERLLLGFVVSAESAGAVVANYVEATEFLRQGNRIIGAQVRDLLTGQEFEIKSRVVINCAGAWIDDLLSSVSLRSTYATSIAINLIVDQVWTGVAAGLPSRPTNDRPSQILFFVPWQDKTMIGTWHIPWGDKPGSFKLNETLLQGFIKEINSAHPSIHLKLEDVHRVTWGFLPVNKEHAGTGQVKLTRDGVVIDHQKNDQLERLISVIGVKYTTARVVAEKAVDLAVNKLGIHVKKCRTHITQIDGGQIEDFKAFMQQTHSNAPKILDADVIDHLVYTYGSNVHLLLALISEQPDLGMRVDADLPITKAEVVHAVRHEIPMTLNDIIQRRTSLGAAGLPSMASLQSCAEIMGSELDWGDDRVNQEVSAVIEDYALN